MPNGMPMSPSANGGFDPSREYHQNGHPAPFAQVQPVPQSPRRDRFAGPPPSSSPQQYMPSRLSDPPMAKPPPRRSSAQANQSPVQYQPQQQQQQHYQPSQANNGDEDDMVDSVAFMLGSTALNDAGALGDEDIGHRNNGPVSSSNQQQSDPSRSRVGRLLRNR